MSHDNIAWFLNLWVAIRYTSFLLRNTLRAHWWYSGWVNCRKLTRYAAALVGARLLNSLVGFLGMPFLWLIRRISRLLTTLPGRVLRNQRLLLRLTLKPGALWLGFLDEQIHCSAMMSSGGWAMNEKAKLRVRIVSPPLETPLTLPTGMWLLS
jgi:hypothetical protein